MNILVVDDDPDVLLIASVVLGNAGYHVRSTREPVEGFMLAGEQYSDIMLIDYFMPGMDGVALLRLLKTSPATSSIPVIVMTAKTDPALACEFLDQGAREIVTKPFDPLELLAAVERVIG